MNTTFRFGRIAGIDIGVNWTWFAIFGLIVWTLSQNIFPSENPGLSDNTYIAMGAVAALAFFASLLGHELGHAVQARRDGMEIEGITLWLLGGVAKFKGQFPSAGAEFRIAIAGPLVSLVLGVIFVLVAMLPLPGTVDGVVSWLGYINLLLLVFNLLPALPLDGGRLLRSTLWHFKRSYAPSTRLAAAIGRLFGFGFIAAGIAFLFLDGTFQGLWLAFIGWFLLQASGRGSAVRLEHAQSRRPDAPRTDDARTRERPARRDPRAVHGRNRGFAATHDLPRRRWSNASRSAHLSTCRRDPADAMGDQAGQRVHGPSSPGAGVRRCCTCPRCSQQACRQSDPPRARARARAAGRPRLSERPDSVLDVKPRRTTLRCLLSGRRRSR